MDKLGERLAFERAGTRPYEAFLRKCRLRPDQLGPVEIGRVEHCMAEEARHFAMRSEVITQLGGDPTVQTPSADAAAVQSMGLVQAVTDPNTTVLQSLQALLTAELVDGAAWELLIALMTASGQDEMTEPFQQALQEEEEHLVQVRQWYQDATLAEGRVGAGEGAGANA